MCRCDRLARLAAVAAQLAYLSAYMPLNRKRLLSAFFLSICVVSCVREDTSKSISDVIRDQKDLDGKQISLHGFVEIDVLGGLNFVEERGPLSGDRITESIDVLPRDAEMRGRFSQWDSKCVVVRSALHLWGQHNVPISGFSSKYGFVEVDSAHKCNR
jgi:hypothetical protein